MHKKHCKQKFTTNKVVANCKKKKKPYLKTIMVTYLQKSNIFVDVCEPKICKSGTNGYIFKVFKQPNINLQTKFRI